MRCRNLPCHLLSLVSDASCVPRRACLESALNQVCHADECFHFSRVIRPLQVRCIVTHEQSRYHPFDCCDSSSDACFLHARVGEAGTSIYWYYCYRYKMLETERDHRLNQRYTPTLLELRTTYPVAIV
jgi:hypothetical protein